MDTFKIDTLKKTIPLFCFLFLLGSTYLNGQNVGVGILNPLRPLHSNGSHLISNGLSMLTANDTSAFTIIDDMQWQMKLDGNEIQVYDDLSAEVAQLNLQRFGGNVRIYSSLGIGAAPSSSYRLDVAGRLNLNKNIGTAPALFVNGDEALWYNGTYFSWGFGGTANYFADKVGIGIADPSAKLHVVGSAIISDLGISNGGDVRVNASGGLTSVEEVYSISPASFDCNAAWSGGGVLGGVSHGFRADGIVVSGRNGDDDCPIMVAGLTLSHGDEIDRVNIYLRDDSENKELKIQLWKKSHNSDMPVLLGETKTDGLVLINPFIITVGSGEIINNRTHSYFLKVFCFDKGKDENTVVQWPPEIEIRGIFIE